MKNLELSATRSELSSFKLKKIENKSAHKFNRTNLEKITIAVAAAVAIGTITYGGYCLIENTKEARNYEIIARENGYPEAIPCPAPSDPREKEIANNNSVVVGVEKPTPCPTPTETSNLG